MDVTGLWQKIFFDPLQFFWCSRTRTLWPMVHGCLWTNLMFIDNRKSAESKKTVPDESLDDDPRPRRGSFCSIGEAQRIGHHASVQTKTHTLIQSEFNINVQWRRIGQPISDRHFHYLSHWCCTSVMDLDSGKINAHKTILLTL